jgi:hypothetical protein
MITGLFAARDMSISCCWASGTCSGFELLYTAVNRQEKRPTKAFIDVASNRFGDMLGGGMLMGVIFIIPQPPVRMVLAMAAVTSFLALLIVARLKRGYIDQLVGSLRSGELPLGSADTALDATTRRVLAETTINADREQLMARIAERTGELAPDTGGSGLIEPQSRLGVMADLTSGEHERMRRGLRSDLIDVAMVPHLIPLLGHADIANDARMELRWLVPRIVGQLVDGLLDPDLSLVVRQRIPGVLEVYHNPRVVRGLIDGLHDHEFFVRYSCARALARMIPRSTELSIPRETVFAAVLWEVKIDNTTWTEQASGAFERLPEEIVDELDEPGIDLSLQHVFTILGLVLDGDAIKLAMLAVASKDRALRGTALEYLENVLPTEIRHRLWRHLGVTVYAPQRKRTRREILDALRQSADVLRRGRDG